MSDGNDDFLGGAKALLTDAIENNDARSNTDTRDLIALAQAFALIALVDELRLRTYA